MLANSSAVSKESGEGASGFGAFLLGTAQLLKQHGEQERSRPAREVNRQVTEESKEFGDGRTSSALTVSYYDEAPELPAEGSLKADENLDGSEKEHPIVEKPAKEFGIDAKNFKRTLQQVEKGHDNCCNVLYSIYFTILFVAVVILHLDPQATYQVEATMVEEFVDATFNSGNKGYYDVNNFGQFWLWLNEVVVPRSFKQYDDLGLLLQPSDWSRVATFNKLVAGVRLRTTRASNSTCPDPKMSPLYGQTDCYKVTSVSTEDYGLPSCNLSLPVDSCYNESRYDQVVNVTYDEGFNVRPGDTVFEFFLDKYDKIATLSKRTAYLQERRWLDDATKSTSVHLLTYNGELDIFCALFLNQNYQRGGAVQLSYEISSAFADPYPYWWYYLLDSLFALYVLYKFVMECLELWPYIRSGKPSDYLKNEDGYWNIVDWLAIALSVTLIAFWIQYAIEITNVTTQFVSVGEENLTIGERIAHNRHFLSTDAYQMYLNHVSTAADGLVAAVNTRSTVRYLAAFNSFLIILRFFKVARFLPRANLLVKTVEFAMVDLVHYAAVFLFVMMAFAIEGWLVFGHRIENFGTLWNSIQTSMLIVMSAVDTTALYDEMYLISPVVTIVWYWSFFFMTILIVMNLLIAIIIDAYSAARGSLKDRDTLWGEVVHVQRILTLYWRPGYLRPRDVLRCFEPGGSLQGHDFITPDLLVKQVEAPGTARLAYRRVKAACGCCGGQQGQGCGRSRRGGPSAVLGVRAPAYSYSGAAAGVVGDDAASVSSGSSGARRRSTVSRTANAQSDGALQSPRSPPAACESGRVVVHLDRRYAEFLVADAVGYKAESDEAQGISLSDAAKEITDALVRMKLMGDRFTKMEGMLLELLSRGEHGAAAPQLVHIRELPEVPTSRRVRERMSVIGAENADAAVAATAQHILAHGPVH